MAVAGGTASSIEIAWEDGKLKEGAVMHRPWSLLATDVNEALAALGGQARAVATWPYKATTYRSCGRSWSRPRSPGLWCGPSFAVSSLEFSSSDVAPMPVTANRHGLENQGAHEKEKGDSTGHGSGFGRGSGSGAKTMDHGEANRNRSAGANVLHVRMKTQAGWQQKILILSDVHFDSLHSKTQSAAQAPGPSGGGGRWDHVHGRFL